MFKSKPIINVNLNKLDVIPPTNMYINIDADEEQLNDFTPFVNKLIK